MFNEEEQQQDTSDGFFTNLENTKPYLKVAAEGFPGSGKTYTLKEIAIGLHRRIGSTKPIVLFDTEKAAKFLKPFFDEAGIQTLHKESRSLADLAESMKRCHDGVADILLIDSITHVWENFLKAYKRRKEERYKKTIERLSFDDWGPIKDTWKSEFAERFVQGHFHALMTGRAGYEYEDIVDENDKRQIVKSGIKMKAEGETAYEPDILLLMTRHEELLGTGGAAKKVWREATVLKDRSTLTDGKTFTNPTYEDFSPAVDRVLLDAKGEHASPERDAASLFRTAEDSHKYAKERTIALEEVQGYLVSVYPGQTAVEKRSKSDALAFAFQTRSWEKIESLSPKELQDGLAKIQEFVKQQKAETAS